MRNSEQTRGLIAASLAISFLAGVFVCLLVVSESGCVAWAAVQTTTIAGKVLMPNGAVATGGTIVATLAGPGSVDDLTTGEGERVAGRYAGTIGADGSVTNLVLVPNDVIIPGGTYYHVSFTVAAPVRTSWSERWTVTTSPDPIDVGDVTRLDVIPSLMLNLNALSDVTVSSPANNQHLVFNSSTGQWENKGFPAGSAVLNYGASNGFCQANLITVTGAAVGDALAFGSPGTLDDVWTFQAHVQSTNLIRIVGCCHDPINGICNLSGTFSVKVIK